MASSSRTPNPTWPSITEEQVSWKSHYAPGSASRNQIRRHQGPYRASIAPTIADRRVEVPAWLSALVDDAGAEIARFDAELGSDLAPFVTVLLRSESAASSKIENLTASARAIAEAEIRSVAGATNAAQIVANTRAMTAAIDMSRDISPQSILAMHDALLRPHDPNIAGQWRTEQVWIGGGYLGPHEADFVPPRHVHIPAAMDDLTAFMRRDDIPVLVQAAIAHAQFETIHPFANGNGRTGRALVHSLLRGKGLARHVTVPVSAGLLVDVDSYFSALTAYRSGDFVPIVTQFAHASFAAMHNGRTLMADLHQIRQSWNERVRARQGAHTWRIADLLLSQPVVNSAIIARECHIALANVYSPLQPLVDAGVLIQAGDAKRSRVWRSPEVLRALDAFSARAGKRRART
ncbi:MAG: Fic family protein [Candidatus Nanopelagicales bacterium]|nr:Fic family protein [Candidatus Nanopelagicales bacterium]